MSTDLQLLPAQTWRTIELTRKEQLKVEPVGFPKAWQKLRAAIARVMIPLNMVVFARGSPLM